MTGAPSKSAIFQARLAVALLIGLIVVGALWYGVSTEGLERMWDDLVARPSGPMAFRFILQPAMAAIAALRDGVSDARLGRPAYLWVILHSPDERGERLGEGIISTARILLLGIVIDTVYQIAVLHTFFPGEAAVIALVLAFVPYVLLRGPITRIARRWVARPAAP